ncbi:MAG: hypothetical protein HY784_03555, partial [Chloroflexi bacterium]|nr:hypothetical protein [Chloroflexota bacterium]
MFYEGISALPFDDLDALEEHGWEVADDQAYPVPVFFWRDKGLRRPDPTELAWLEVALRAIPELVRDHLRPDGKGDYQPLDLTLTVPTHAGDKLAQAKYPAGLLPRESRPAQPEHWDFPDDEEADEEDMPVFDRRMMEGSMAEMLSEIGEGAMPGDPRLQKAQKLMYRAWEETNPAKRLTLAHKALATSPNCADAYVLLAEEEADTVARAL